jgi:hypothetical protein
MPVATRSPRAAALSMMIVSLGRRGSDRSGRGQLMEAR